MMQTMKIHEIVQANPTLNWKCMTPKMVMPRMNKSMKMHKIMLNEQAAKSSKQLGSSSSDEFAILRLFMVMSAAYFAHCC